VSQLNDGEQKRGASVPGHVTQAVVKEVV